MTDLVFASSNAGKIKELTHILNQYHVIPQSEFNIESVEETGLTFVENAILKARHAAKLSKLPAIADDSGLEVDALNGMPGIYSARYAENDERGHNQKLLDEMSGVPEAQRTARFQCVLVYMRHELDPMPIICQGTLEGSILLEVRGEGGFGYDPVFYVPEFDCSAAELGSELKNKISHRAKALAKLTAYL